LERRDIALGVGLFVLGQLESWTYVSTRPRGAAALALALYALSVAIGRRAPVAAAALVVATTVVVGVISSNPGSATLLVAWAIAFFRLGTDPDPRRLVAGIVLIVAMAIASIPAADGNLANWIAANSVGDVLPLLAGLLWGRHTQARTLRAEAARLAAERDRVEREAVERERERLARELHDVVSHTVGTIVVQAEAGDVLLDRDPEAARRSLNAIESEAREAMTELRRLLGLLRADGADAENSSPMRPQPGLADLDGLAERVRTAGLPVDVVVEGDPVPLPAALDLSAYRVVQEGLTNALKHTAGARARVRVAFRADGLELEVTDDGDPRDGIGTGHGLVGTRERVALLGGSFAAGPLEPRGWRLAASLPLSGE
jgi:signal transduction histidine kinase